MTILAKTSTALGVDHEMGDFRMRSFSSAFGG
jgi:hypothetical protein